jgi:hypothetical protein
MKQSWPHHPAYSICVNRAMNEHCKNKGEEILRCREEKCFPIKSKK